jgi:isoleucyl-tRNA synthetase
MVMEMCISWHGRLHHGHLPSNTALTVGPKIDYVLIKTYNQYTFKPINVILAKALVEKQFAGKFEKTDSSTTFCPLTSQTKRFLTILSLNVKDKIL